MYSRAKSGVCGEVMPFFYLEESGVMTFADDDQSDPRLFPARINKLASIS